MAAPPQPKTLLGRYRPLAPTASVKVSPLCLGAMSFGQAWKAGLGECDKPTSFAILDHFYQSGGNFVDTANNYQNEESETWLGEWMEQRGVRDQIVLATKYSSGFRRHQPDEIQANSVGNNTKSLRVSVEASLRKLRTDYIDLLYIHWWDFHTPVEEIMQSLNQLVAAGKVLYLGVSDTPAWLVSRANQYARDHGLRGFSVYQGQWSAATRDFERDVIPMCAAEGMGLCPWGSLGGGKFKSAAQREEIARSGTDPGRQNKTLSEGEEAVSAALERVAQRHQGSGITGVALAYVRQKTPYVVPIVGNRTLEHMKSNIEALSVVLSDEDIREIEEAYPFDVGFPMNFLYKGPVKEAHPAHSTWMNEAGHFDYVENPKPIMFK